MGEAVYILLAVNNRLTFVNFKTDVYTTTINSAWRHVRATLPITCRSGKLEYFLVDLLFTKLAKKEGGDKFCKFLDIDWSIHSEEVHSFA